MLSKGKGFKNTLSINFIIPELEIWHNDQISINLKGYSSVNTDSTNYECKVKEGNQLSHRWEEIKATSLSSI